MYLVGTFTNHHIGDTHTLFFEYGQRISENKREIIAEKFLAYAKENNILKAEATAKDALKIVKNELYFGKYSNIEFIDDSRYKTENGSFHLDNYKIFKL